MEPVLRMGVGIHSAVSFAVTKVDVGLRYPVRQANEAAAL